MHARVFLIGRLYTLPITLAHALHPHMGMHALSFICLRCDPARLLERVAMLALERVAMLPTESWNDLR